MITYFLKGKKPITETTANAVPIAKQIAVAGAAAAASIENPCGNSTVPTTTTTTTKVQQPTCLPLTSTTATSIANNTPAVPATAAAADIASPTPLEDLSPESDFDANMNSLTAQRRKSLCRQHNISSSFGTTFSGSGITPSHSNSSSVHTINVVPPLPSIKSSSTDDSTKPALPKTLLNELKDELASEKTGVLKDSIENLEILLKNNISLSDLSNKQQLSLRPTESTRSLMKKDTIVNFKTETLSSLKRKSVTTITTTTRVEIRRDQNGISIAPKRMEDSANDSKDWEEKLSLEPQRSPIKSSQSMSPIGLSAKAFVVLPNSRSLTLITHNGTNGYVLQDVTT